MGTYHVHSGRMELSAHSLQLRVEKIKQIISNAGRESECTEVRGAGSGKIPENRHWWN